MSKRITKHAHATGLRLKRKRIQKQVTRTKNKQAKLAKSAEADDRRFEIVLRRRPSMNFGEGVFVITSGPDYPDFDRFLLPEHSQGHIAKYQPPKR